MTPKEKTMKSTDATIAIHRDGDGFTTVVFGLRLADEDIEVVENVIKPELESTTGTKHDLADCLMTCLTYGIHRAYEDAEGVPWTLRMDRKKKDA